MKTDEKNMMFENNPPEEIENNSLDFQCSEEPEPVSSESVLSPEQEILQIMKKDLEEQREFRQKEWKMIKTCSIGLIFVLVLATGLLLFLFPKVSKLGKVVNSADELTVTAQVVLDNLEEISDEVKGEDGLIHSIKTLVENSDKAIEEAVSNMNESFEKIKALDFESLNTAIQGLRTVIEPLSRLFGR